MGFNFNTCFCNKLGCKWLFGDKWPPEAIFEMLVMANNTRATFETPKYHTLGGLEISIRHQTVNTLELSAVFPHQIEVPPHPPHTHTHATTKRYKKLFNMVISLVKFQTTNTYVATKNKIIIRYMYIYTRYARFFNACFACISFTDFPICRPPISFTIFIKSLLLLVTFRLNIRHG